MEMNIIKQEKQPLLSRTEITAEISFEGPTPSRYEIIQLLSKKLGSKKELTLVKHIFTEYGATNAEVEGFVYDDAKVMEVLEKKVRKFETPQKAESPGETPAPATPSENKTEETPKVEEKAPEQKPKEVKEEESKPEKTEEPKGE